MTTLKALLAKIGLNYPGLDDAATVALIDQGLDGTETYSSQYSEQVEIASAGLIFTLITSVDRISEGGYTISMNSDKLRTAYTLIINKYGLPDLLNPSITDRSDAW